MTDIVTNSSGFDYDALSYLYKQPVLAADLKTELDDFLVDEIMPIECSGEGEHIWLKITKSGCNTDYVATELEKFAGVKQVAVSYAGLKDRYGVTTQWFSVQLPGQEGPDWKLIGNDEFTIEQVCRHSRKLKRGALSGNRFKIRLRNLQGDKESWQAQLEKIAANGVPNYFGLQRFGHAMGNLRRAADLLLNNKMRRLKPHKRGIYLSAMRSWIFNQIVSRRISANSFTVPLQGDVFMLATSQACFVDEINDELLQRLADQQIHITAAMWGRGQSMATDQVNVLEQQVADQYTEFAKGLEMAGLKQERRAMRVMPVDLQWQFEAENSLSVSFDLTKGSYATAVLRELCQIHDKSK